MALGQCGLFIPCINDICLQPKNDIREVGHQQSPGGQKILLDERQNVRSSGNHFIRQSSKTVGNAIVELRRHIVKPHGDFGSELLRAGPHEWYPNRECIPRALQVSLDDGKIVIPQFDKNFRDKVKVVDDESFKLKKIHTRLM